MPYADVNGLHLYFEQCGEGPPLVLLHGGLLTIELSFGVAMPVLAEHHRVIAVELQGHGRTADIDRPMTFDSSPPTSWACWTTSASSGRTCSASASVGSRPTSCSSTTRTVSGGRSWPRPTTAMTGEVKSHPERLPTEADFAAMREAYAAVAPDPSHFEAFAEKTGAMVHGFEGWTDDQLRAIDAPVLVLIGDTDFILVPNAAEAAELLPRGQLAVLPGDHPHGHDPQRAGRPGGGGVPQAVEPVVPPDGDLGVVTASPSSSEAVSSGPGPVPARTNLDRPLQRRWRPGV